MSTRNARLWMVLALAASADAWLPSTTPTTRSMLTPSRQLYHLPTKPSRRQQCFQAIDTAALESKKPTSVAGTVPGLGPNLPLRGIDGNTETREFTPFQQFARAAPMATMAFYAVHPEPLDRMIDNIWAWIYSLDVVHTGLFEAHVASFSFVFFIAAYSVVHLILGEDLTKQHRLDGQMPQENPMAWATLEGVWLWFNPLVGYLTSIWMYQQVLNSHQAPPLLAPTFGVLVVEVFFGVFLYDLLFCPIHVLFHKCPKELGPVSKAIRSVHGYHHRHANGSLNSIETVQNSYIDGGLQVLCNILVQHISPFGGPKHLLSRIIHNIIVTYMLTETHTGYNFPWMSHNIWPEFLGGTPRHERHHKDGRVYYQQFFTYIDDALGWTDQDLQNAKQMKQQRRLAARPIEADVATMSENNIRTHHVSN